MKYTYRVRDNYGNLWSQTFTTPAKAIKYAKEQNKILADELWADHIDYNEFTVEVEY